MFVHNTIKIIIRHHSYCYNYNVINISPIQPGSHGPNPSIYRMSNLPRQGQITSIQRTCGASLLHKQNHPRYGTSENPVGKR